MKKIKKIILYLSLISFLNSCQSLDTAGKVFRNEKIRTTDEFLVKKRNPLVLPPDYKKLPEPGSILKKDNNDDEKIKKILKAPQQNKSLSNKSSTVEESILNRIRK